MAFVQLAMHRKQAPTQSPAAGSGMEWDTIYAAQRRMAAYVQEAAAHAMAVPFLLITVGILAVIVMERVLRGSPNGALLTIVMGAVFLAMSAGAVRPAFGMVREAKRLRELDARIQRETE